MTKIINKDESLQANVHANFYTNFHIIIPARFHSKRLPGKPLLDLHGKTLIQRVYEQATLCGAKSIVIATDNESIEQEAKKFGANVCRTSASHHTGTDRLAEAVQLLDLKDDEIIVNLQGDEPLVPPYCVQKVAAALQDNPTAFCTTACTPIVNAEHLKDPNIVKVVLNKLGFALYFSRAIIPFPREFTLEAVIQKQNEEQTPKKNNYFRHIGLFSYRVSSLKEYASFSQSPLEALEHLEQLRILWHGKTIQVTEFDEVLPPGVDTLTELEFMRRYFEMYQLDSVLM